MIKLDESNVLKKYYSIKISLDEKTKTRWVIKDKNKIEAEITIYKDKRSDDVLLNMRGLGRYFLTFDSALAYFVSMKKNTFNTFNAFDSYDSVDIEFIYK